MRLWVLCRLTRDSQERPPDMVSQSEFDRNQPRKAKNALISAFLFCMFDKSYVRACSHQWSTNLLSFKNQHIKRKNLSNENAHFSLISSWHDWMSFSAACSEVTFNSSVFFFNFTYTNTSHFWLSWADFGQIQTDLSCLEVSPENP